MRKIIWLMIVCLLAGLFITTVISISQNQSMTTSESNDDPAIALLKQYHWVPQGPPTTQLFTVPDLVDYKYKSGDPPFNLYLEASKAVNLDFTPQIGQQLELRAYPLGIEPKEKLSIYGYLLVKGNQVVGAWLSVKGQRPGIHALDAKLEDLIQP